MEKKEQLLVALTCLSFVNEDLYSPFSLFKFRVYIHYYWGFGGVLALKHKVDHLIHHSISSYL